MRTFGSVIASARRAAGLTQRELAALILREGESGGISPAYINDIEHDRRTPNDEKLIVQFAQSVEVDARYLLLLASSQLPEEIAARARSVDASTYCLALEAFERVLREF